MIQQHKELNNEKASLWQQSDLSLHYSLTHLFTKFLNFTLASF